MDSILHAEHKIILEEMRSDYFHQQAAVNGEGLASDSEEEDLDLVGINGIEKSIYEDEDEEKEEEGFVVKRGIEFDNPIPFNYVLDLRNFLPSSSPKNVKRYYLFFFGPHSFVTWF